MHLNVPDDDAGFVSSQQGDGGLVPAFLVSTAASQNMQVMYRRIYNLFVAAMCKMMACSCGHVFD